MKKVAPKSSTCSAQSSAQSSAQKKMKHKRFQKYECVLCAYSTSNITNYKKHLKTKKHLKKADGKSVGKVGTLGKQKSSLGRVYLCEYCDTEYGSKSSFYRHKKECDLIQEIKKLKKSEKNLNNIIDTQKQFVKMATETNKSINMTNSNNVINNQNTNNISINMYLNEHCKNAMNLTDFVKNIKLQLSDIIPESNYIDCVSNILIKNLKDLQPTERPIHCSDPKRLQFYVKDGESWEKDVDKIDTSIDDIHTKQFDLLHKFDENNKNNTEDTFLERQKIANIVHEASLGDKKGINDAIKRKIKETVDFKMNIENVD